MYYFANNNDALNQAYKIPGYAWSRPQPRSEPRPLQMQDAIYAQYRNEPLSPNNRFIDLQYSEIIFPKERYTGLNKIRNRVDYAEDAPISGSIAVADYASNGIDRNSEYRRTFWSNTW